MFLYQRHYCVSVINHQVFESIGCLFRNLAYIEENPRVHSSDPIQHRFHCVSSEGEEESFLSARKAVPERVERLSYFWVLKGAHAESSHFDNLLDEGTRENSLPVVEHTLGYEATEDLDLLSVHTYISRVFGRLSALQKEACNRVEAVGELRGSCFDRAK